MTLAIHTLHRQTGRHFAKSSRRCSLARQLIGAKLSYRTGSYRWPEELRLPAMHYCSSLAIVVHQIDPSAGARPNVTCLLSVPCRTKIRVLQLLRFGNMPISVGGRLRDRKSVV